MHPFLSVQNRASCQQRGLPSQRTPASACTEHSRMDLSFLSETLRDTGCRGRGETGTLRSDSTAGLPGVQAPVPAKWHLFALLLLRIEHRHPTANSHAVITWVGRAQNQTDQDPHGRGGSTGQHPGSGPLGASKGSRATERASTLPCPEAVAASHGRGLLVQRLRGGVGSPGALCL